MQSAQPLFTGCTPLQPKAVVLLLLAEPCYRPGLISPGSRKLEALLQAGQA